MVGLDGNVRGRLVAREAEIHGQLIGTLCARLVTLKSTSYLEADILHSELIVEEDAIFVGNVEKRDSITLPQELIKMEQENEKLTEI